MHNTIQFRRIQTADILSGIKITNCNGINIKQFKRCDPADGRVCSYLIEPERLQEV